MKKALALLLAALLAFSSFGAFAATYNDKDTVKKVQQALNDAGYNCGTPDGVAGKKTYAAISSYQKDKGLAQTHQIDDALLQALGLVEAQNGSANDVSDASNPSPESEEMSSSENEIDFHDPDTFVYWMNLMYQTDLESISDQIAAAGIDTKAVINSFYVGDKFVTSNMNVISYNSQRHQETINFMGTVKDDKLVDCSGIQLGLTTKDGNPVHIDLPLYHFIVVFLMCCNEYYGDTMESLADNLKENFVPDENGFVKMDNWVSTDEVVVFDGNIDGVYYDTEIYRTDKYSLSIYGTSDLLFFDVKPV